MYKLSATFAVLVALGGCAAAPLDQNAQLVAGSATLRAESPSAPSVSAAPSASLSAAPTEPAAAVDISEFNQPTICKKITRPGSRIVIGEQCYTPDASPAVAEAHDEMVRWQIEQLRREQYQLEQMQRQQELERQRSMMERMHRMQ